MKSNIEQLIRSTHAKFDWNLFSRLDGENVDAFLNEINDNFSDPLFDYHLHRKMVTNAEDLPESFVTLGYDSMYVYRTGNTYISEGVGKIDPETLVAKEIVFIQDYPKKMTGKGFVEVIYSLYPKINFFLLATVPFVIIPAFYSNLFNTRLIFNDMVTTLFYVTMAFLLLWGVDYGLKRFIKHRHLNRIDENALKIERYMLSIVPYLPTGSALMKVRTIESNRKTIWENISGVIVDFVSICLVVGILFAFIGFYAFGLVLFYFGVMLGATYMRYRNYTVYIELEAAQQDLLTERISYYRNNTHLRFFDNAATLDSFEQSCKKSYHSDHGITSFNFNWDELVRVTTFLASTVLFTVIFFSSKANPEIFNVLIACLILNGRVASSVVSLVTKSFFIMVSTYHMHTALKDVFETFDDKLFSKGLQLDKISRITLNNVSIMNDEKTLVQEISTRFTKGNIYGFYGNVGSGKSTLMQTILRNHHNYSGSVVFNDFYNLRDIDPTVFGKRVAYLDPSSDFLKGSLYSNFYVRGIRDTGLIAKVCTNIFPDAVIDYEFVFVRDISTIPMSTGQKRKLLLMMTLNKTKELVVLDEAFINMSVVDIAQMIVFLKTELSQAIVLIVSHDRQILNQLDNLYEIREGGLNMIKNSIVKVV
ncbi:hypothetical protein A8L45_08435 [Veronia pacifica]|uniref:ABC transporter domain-containing protein n=2 Tax=Veronia pacifica TaxID=1080227 RepID=A0A1C3EKU4_9GAMM|nr:hypothetical protein A8L45_08435 [Veronia pacifica]